MDSQASDLPEIAAHEMIRDDQSGPWAACAGEYGRLLQCTDPRTLEAEVERNEQQLARLQMLQTQLRTHSREMHQQAHLALLSSLAAPIRRISEDIFRQILICGWSDTEIAERARFTACAASVCRSWREVVLDISLLWSTIYIDLSDPPSRTLKRLRLFVERSREQKLEIDIDVYAVETCYSVDEDTDGSGSDEGSNEDSPEESSTDDSNDSDESFYIIDSESTASDDESEKQSLDLFDLRSSLRMWYMTELLDILLPHLQRWLICTIKLPFREIMDDLLVSLHGCADAMQEFRIIFSQPDTSAYGAISVCQKFPSQFRAPKLRILELRHIQLPSDVILQRLFPSLRTLVLCEAIIEGITLARLLRMLQSLQHLEHLTLEENRYQPSLSVDEGFARAHLAALQTLVVICQIPADVSALFSVFTAPNLASFEYRNPAIYLRNMEQARGAPLIAQRMRYFPSLEKIDVHMPHCDIPLRNVSWWIRGFQNARICVNIKDLLEPAEGHRLHTGLSSIVTDLAEPTADQQPQLFFGLSSVTIHRTRGLSVGMLRRMVQGRMRCIMGDAHIAPLRELRVYTEVELLSEDRVWFERNLESFGWSSPSEGAQSSSSITLYVGSL